MIDFLLVDLPPGTGDIQLTLLQKMPLDATIVITTPQEVSLADTKKGVEMIKKLEDDKNSKNETINDHNLVSSLFNNG